ncbi:HTH-type transcriptional regulator Ptr1 [uncultured archaeon]|nr:HTH-type transcriptional regulator Ptr1 [uncultured archaeon]
MLFDSFNKPKKISQIDALDRKILNLLSDNSRRKLIDIARELGLSIPSTKARIGRLVDEKIITRFTIHADTEKTGMPIGVHVRVKLNKITEARQNEFIAHLKKNKNVIDIFSIIGQYDLLLVVIAESSTEINKILFKIRHDFTDIISDWETNYIMEIYKLEEYSY